jgi:ABC-type transporter Mla subunit MlaD
MEAARRTLFITSMRVATLLIAVCLLSSCSDSGGRVVHAVLPAARNLREGAPVRFRGIEVGKVTTVRIVDSGVRLDLDIERADAPLRSADQVRIAAAGMFGDAEVEIVPGPASAPKLASDGWLPAFPPDTLAALREELMGAIAKATFGRLGVHDSASAAQQRADSVHPPPARPHP